MAHEHFNPKRRLRRVAGERAVLEALADRVTYAGNPVHKRNPGDFGLDPPAAPRRDKSLCDEVRIFTRSEAGALLRAGVRMGLISEASREGWPQNIWAVVDGVPLEAQLENVTLGTYHGYPLQPQDPLCEQIVERWRGQ